ncbi:UNVERIFIED_CONTAM: Lipe [Trichonephila clavipes]
MATHLVCSRRFDFVIKCFGMIRKMFRAKSTTNNYDFEVIYLSLMNNIDYFFYNRDKYWYSDRFILLLKDLLSHFEWYEQNVGKLYDNAPRFDFNNIEGNGFRSFCLIFERCFTDCYRFCKKLINARSSMFFRPEAYLKELENIIDVVSALKPGLQFVFKLLAENSDDQLLTPDKAITAEEVIIECGGISQFGFYGRHQGFYYCTSMKRILQGVSVIMATFSDLYRTAGGPISKAALTILNGLKYILNPELRSEHIVDVAQNSSVEFLKAFWSLSETQFMKQLPGWVCPKMHVREVIFIPDKPVILNNIYSNESVVIPAPTSHIPSAPVRCLLLSAIQRDGQILKKNKRKSNLAPKSKSLLFHCHGGGFISQNPESHEIYLRHWAYDLNVPIISVDYSLSPEAPFPRAIEEVLLTYAWVLKNPDKLGWTGETICFAGDSAGGNVLMSVILKTITMQIRKPDAIMCCYTPLILDIVPSPSRLLCWIDPLLPLGFMISCMNAYAGNVTTEGDEYDVESEHALSGRSRKISSISEIFDSSINFLKQNEWMEVEANEPPEKIENVCHEADDYTDFVDSNNYIHEAVKECDKKSYEENQNPSFSYDEEYIVFDLPLDLFFDVKTKCHKVADFGLNKISDMFMSTSFYQKVISPFLPNIGLHSQAKIQSTYDKKASILQKIRMLKIISKNPFMSPLLASDEILKEMPPVYFLSLNFDPCLDDSITFAKRLQSLNRRVVVDVLDGLPHGFLNFLPFSQEAHDGSNLCVRRLKEVLKLS